MSAAKTLVILLVFTLAAEAKHPKRCKTTADCRNTECCTRRRCKSMIAIGNRCNIHRQIMGYQCPCTLGTTCKETRPKKTRTTKNKRQKTRKRMICRKILWPLDGVEKVEHYPRVQVSV